MKPLKVRSYDPPFRFEVESASEPGGWYLVDLAQGFCGCLDHEIQNGRKRKIGLRHVCKHQIRAKQFAMEKYIAGLKATIDENADEIFEEALKRERKRDKRV